METSDITILTLAIIHIVLAIANWNNTLNAVILATTALLIVIYVIVTVRGRNALERKYEQLEIDLANQVKATDEYERQLKDWQVAQYGDIATKKFTNPPKDYEVIKRYDVPNDTTHISNIDNIQTSETHTIIDYPFTEEIKQCECGANMRETKCYWICDNCKKRIRK